MNYTGMKETAIKNHVRLAILAWATHQPLPTGVTITDADVTQIDNNVVAIHVGDVKLDDGSVVEVCGKITVSALEYTDKTYAKKAPTYAFERLIEGDDYQDRLAQKAADKAEKERQKALNPKKSTSSAKAARQAEMAERAAELDAIAEKVKVKRQAESAAAVANAPNRKTDN